MKSNSYARVACKILKYLNDCYENGLDANIDSLNANMLGISNRQLYETMKMLSDDGYVKGIEFMDVIPPENSVLNHPRNWHITSQGIEYLEENSLMQKAYKVAKEARDWLPLI
ncbi:YjcQ family protein [Ligilactobacillus murinus]|uniref:YjcQ family protein n=1 Tax=Ligilactobacillus murinus TaxID=1622 RepID=UPI000B5CB552|nr:YjcQ family protein [Ligilactobacillus murinus]